MNETPHYLPANASNSSVATRKLEEYTLAGAKLRITYSHSRPHPFDYGGRIFNSVNGPQWEIENTAERERYWRDLAFFYYAKANKLLPTEDNN
jgi:hypothetical protein